MIGGAEISLDWARNNCVSVPLTVLFSLQIPVLLNKSAANNGGQVDAWLAKIIAKQRLATNSFLLLRRRFRSLIGARGAPRESGRSIDEEQTERSAPGLGAVRRLRTSCQLVTPRISNRAHNQVKPCAHEKTHHLDDL